MALEIFINKGRQSSNSTNLNYFAKYDNIYIMDNHLAAIWCWDKLPKNKQISIVHIDAHYDLGCSPPGRFIYGEVDLTKIAITDIESFQHVYDYQYFMWDNYIHLFNDKYPNLIKEFISITQRLGNQTELKGVEFDEFDIWHLDKPLWLDTETNKILNLDIDYFFKQDVYEKFNIFSEETINFFSNWLLKNKDQFDQITIALSPECCGSWENAIDLTNKILRPLAITIDV